MIYIQRVLPYLTLFLSFNIGATTYFVDVNGSDASPGTRDLPYLTIQKAVNTVRAGDTVIVRDGEYGDSDKNDYVVRVGATGTKDNWITIKAQNKYGAKLVGRNSTGFGVAFIDTARYVRFDGFEITRMRVAGVWGYKSKFITVSNNHIHHNGKLLITDCSDGYGRVAIFTNMFTENFVIKNNLIHDNGRTPNPQCDRLPLAQNHNYRHDHAMYLQGKYHLINNNIIYNHPAGYLIKIDGHVGNANYSKYPYTHVILNNTFGKLTRGDYSAGGVIRIFNNMTRVKGYGVTSNPKPLIQNNIFYKPGGPSSDTAVRITDGVNSNVAGTVIIGNATTSKYLYSENLGFEIQKNVYASNNLVSIELPLQNPEYNNYGFINNCPNINDFHGMTLNFDIKTYDSEYIGKQYIGAIDKL